MKEARCKAVHTVWLHFYEIPEKAKLIFSDKRISWLSGSMGGGENKMQRGTRKTFTVIAILS